MTTLDDAVDIDPGDVATALRLDTAARLRPLKNNGRACAVLRSPIVPIEGDQLPAVAITLPSVSYASISEGHPQFDVELTLRIFCYVAQDKGWDAAADALAQAVLVTLFRDAGWTRGWRATPTVQRVQTHDPMGGQHGVVAIDITGTRAAAEEFWPRDLVSLDRMHIDIDFIDPSRTPGAPDGDIDGEIDLSAPPTA